MKFLEKLWPKGTEYKKHKDGREEIKFPEPTSFPLKEDRFKQEPMMEARNKKQPEEKIIEREHSRQVSPGKEPMRSGEWDGGRSQKTFHTRQENLNQERGEGRRFKEERKKRELDIY